MWEATCGLWGNRDEHFADMQFTYYVLILVRVPLYMRKNLLLQYTVLLLHLLNIKCYLGIRAKIYYEQISNKKILKIKNYLYLRIEIKH